MVGSASGLGGEGGGWGGRGGGALETVFVGFCEP